MKAVAPLLLILVITAGIIGLFIALILWGQKREKERRAIWTAVAQRVGGHLVAASPFGIIVERGDALAFLDTYVVRSNKSSHPYTRCRAAFVLPAGPTFRAYKEGALSSLGKALGSQDVTLGIDPAFDHLFMVKADDPGAVQRALTPTAQGLMRTYHPQSGLSADGATVTLNWHGHERNPDKLQSALDIVLEVARWELGWLDVARSVPGARWVPAAGPFGQRQAPSIAFDSGPAPVRVFPAVYNATLVLRVYARRAGPDVGSVRAIVDARGQPNVAIPPGLVPPASIDAFRSLGEIALGAERDELWVDLLGGTTSDRVEAAVRAVAAAASGAPASAFR